MEPDVLLSIIFQSVIGIVGIPGNCLIIFVYSKKRLTMSPHVFIFGLAITDLGSCLFTPAIIFQRLASYESDFLCRSVTFVNFVSVYLSAFLSTSIVVDRYLAICRPLLRWMTVRRAQIVVACCVLSSVVVSIPVFVSYKMVSFKTDSKPQRACTFDNDYSFFQALMLILLYTVSIATLCVTVIMFWKMWKAVRKRMEIFPMDTAIATTSRGHQGNVSVSYIYNHEPPVPQHVVRIASKTNKTTKMLLAASSIFFFTWAIALCTLSIPRSTLSKVKARSDVGFVIIKILNITFYINHAINPFIYGLINRRFREKCQTYLSCCKQ
ncbi:cholecystokinin receptor type A-like [Asterias rubens]|uniref:cholecystokinin receptor type A-like n=1 Tax=Asterias rubens TaxID=7604 RepID=UPI001455AF5F|nr:cholecystokinin receptor type A-like [Asterias rubens]